MKIHFRYLYLLIAASLVACSSTEGELAAHVVKQIPVPGEVKSEGTFKVGNPYQVKDTVYKPQETYTYSQTGIASWYGPNFDGKKTANGEIFDQNELTAAHRTLQMPSLVRVTNLENGRSIVVRINDRGPFSKGRIIDVSKRAAELLGFKSKGTAKVRVDLLSDESKEIAEAAKRGQDTSGAEVAINEQPYKYDIAYNPSVEPARIQPAAGGWYTPPPIVTAPVSAVPREPQIRYVFGNNAYVAGHTDQGRFMPDPVVSQAAVHHTNIFVQAGSFSNPDNAARAAESLRLINTATVQTVFLNGSEFHRVRLGPLKDVQQADALLNELAQRGYGSAEIVVD